MLRDMDARLRWHDEKEMKELDPQRNDPDFTLVAKKFPGGGLNGRFLSFATMRDANVPRLHGGDFR